MSRNAATFKTHGPFFLVFFLDHQRIPVRSVARELARITPAGKKLTSLTRQRRPLRWRVRLVSDVLRCRGNMGLPMNFYTGARKGTA